jgi:predicted flavoprotein YhiN
LQNLANQLTKELFKSTEKYFQRRICNRWRNRFKEINFKTMEASKRNLYFAGEIVNIDAITGGFNFQNAWTSGYIVANAI